MEKRTYTSDIVRELSAWIRDYPRRHPYELESARDHDVFMSRVRPDLLEINKGSYSKLLKDMRFIDELIAILKAFDMDKRGSKLTSPTLFRECVEQAGQDFDLLSSANVRLETLKLRQEIGGETVDSVTRRIYTLFSHWYMPPMFSSALSLSGGAVVASKVMHMIMPELFIMIDSHVAQALNIICDYNPHPVDGDDWHNVIPNYSYRRLNRSNTENWDDECYIAALVYSKRIILEWCQQNNTDIAGFLNLDVRNVTIDIVRDDRIKTEASTTRIIDKALR